MKNKKKIFVLPGWSYDTSKWNNLIDKLKTEGHEIQKLKIPGLEEKIEKSWNIDDYVAWLDEKIGNEKDVILLGHSNGGRIALSYALKNQDKISHLILIGSAGFIKNDIKSILKRNVFKKIAKTGKLIFPDFTKKYLYKIAREKDYYAADENLKKTMQNLISIDLKKKANQIKIPTIIIWGKNDKVTPISFAKILKSQIQKSKLFIISGAKHSPQYTHPEKVFEIIKNNLS